VLGRENNQGSGHQHEEIPGKRGRLPLETLIVFPASEIGDEGLESAKPDLQSVFKKPGGDTAGL